jgi:hypothetical protein
MAKERAMHPTFEVYVHDTRHPVPTLVLVSASSESRARARARELLIKSPFHVRIDVERDGAHVCSVSRTVPDPALRSTSTLNL